MDRGKNMGPQPYTKNFRKLRKADIGRSGPSQRKAHQLVVYFHTALKTHIQVTLDGFNGQIEGYMCIQMHILTFS